MAVTISISSESIGAGSISCDMLFRPRSTPFVLGSKVVLTSPQVCHLDSGGLGTIVLVVGTYDVTFPTIPGNVDTITIAVPDGTLAANFKDLITSGVQNLPAYASSIISGPGGTFFQLTMINDGFGGFTPNYHQL